MTEPVRILMCAPKHYDVDYVINPWMEGNIHRSSRARAQKIVRHQSVGMSN